MQQQCVMSTLLNSASCNWHVPDTNHMCVCIFCVLCALQPNLLTAAADDRWKAIRKAVAVSFSAQVRAQTHTGSLCHRHALQGLGRTRYRSKACLQLKIFGGRTALGQGGTYGCR